MKKYNNYFLMAITIFVMIVLAIASLASVFKFNFYELDQILVAISISSYFLSYAEIIECNLDLQQNKYLYLKEKYDVFTVEQKEFSRKIEKYIEFVNIQYENNASIVTDEERKSLNSFKNSSIKFNNDYEKSIEDEKQLYLKSSNKLSKKYSVVMTCAFLSLICVLSFESLYKLLEQSNSIFCLSAFLFVVMAMGIKANNSKIYADFKKIIDKNIFKQKQHIKIMNDIMEKYNYGQAQDADGE